MRKLATFTAAAALVAAFGFAGSAMADPNADNVEVFVDTGGNGSTPDNAKGASDGNFAVLGDGGILILEFTENTCLNDTGNDLRIDDDQDGTDEDYNVSVGFIGQTSLTSLGTVTEASPTNIALPVAVVSFNRISLVDQNQQIGGGTAGAEIDALTCLNNFDFGTAFITKTNQGSGNITIQAKTATSNGLQFFEFDITIVNTNNEDLTDIVFEDVLPAEFDLDPIEELDEATGNGGTADDDQCEDPANPTTFVACSTLTVTAVKGSTLCDDGDCDGVEVSAETDANDCTASGDEHTNQGKSNKPFKLQPDIVTMTAVGVDGDDQCVITVWASTDQKATGVKKVNFTPTECNETTFIFLNEGVEVIDTLGTGDPSDDVSLFIDDDRIQLTCVSPTFP